MRLRRIVIVVVNAGGDTPASWSHTLEGPSGADLIGAISNTTIDSAVRSGFDAFRLTVREWESAALKWRCSLSRADAEKLGARGDWHCSNLKFEIAEVAFDDLEPARAAKLAAIKTRLHLPLEEVDPLIEGGADAVRIELK